VRARWSTRRITIASTPDARGARLRASRTTSRGARRCSACADRQGAYSPGLSATPAMAAARESAVAHRDSLPMASGLGASRSPPRKTAQKAYAAFHRPRQARRRSQVMPDGKRFANEGILPDFVQEMIKAQNPARRSRPSSLRDHRHCANTASAAAAASDAARHHLKTAISSAARRWPNSRHKPASTPRRERQPSRVHTTAADAATRLRQGLARPTTATQARRAARPQPLRRADRTRAVSTAIKVWWSGDLGTLCRHQDRRQCGALDADGPPSDRRPLRRRNDMASIMGGNYPRRRLTLGPALTLATSRGSISRACSRRRRHPLRPERWRRLSAHVAICPISDRRTSGSTS